LGKSLKNPALLSPEGYLGLGRQYGRWGSKSEGFNTLVTLLAKGKESYRMVETKAGRFVIQKRGEKLFEDFIELEDHLSRYNGSRLVDILEQPKVVAVLLAGRSGYLFHRFELKDGNWVGSYIGEAYNPDFEILGYDPEIKGVKIDGRDKFHTEGKTGILDTFVFGATVQKNGVRDPLSRVVKGRR
ncbi:MAG: hypothetical protein AAF533_30375, partial [Acidobacteriota bacterium]